MARKKSMLNKIGKVAEHPATWIAMAAAFLVVNRVDARARRRGRQCLRARVAQTGEPTQTAAAWCESDREA